MIIDNKRALAYIVTIDEIKDIPNYDRVVHARVGGWWIIISKSDNLAVGDKCVYFEVDSKVPENDERFSFLEKRHYQVKTLRMCKVYSQGLLMPLSLFPEVGENPEVYTDVTDLLNITYSVAEDNARKSSKINRDAKYQSMTARHKDLFKKPFFRWMMKKNWGRKVMFAFFGRKKDKPTVWPTHFPGVSKTDQERCENMPWVLEDKTPWIKTEKCDGTSGTFILERKRFGRYEFYVCSRNVRMKSREQECFFGASNYYWDAAIKYDIENKMKNYLEQHPSLSFVCWQGEICGPGIQKNPQGLKDLHLFCFHMTDDTGRYDLRDAAEVWTEYDMEMVKIVDDEYILPDDFEEFKQSADGYYSPEMCEGLTKQAREGFVYYNTKNPSQSFKNVSRKYLLKN